MAEKRRETVAPREDDVQREGQSQPGDLEGQVASLTNGVGQINEQLAGLHDKLDQVLEQLDQVKEERQGAAQARKVSLEEQEAMGSDLQTVPLSQREQRRPATPELPRPR